MRLAFSWIVFIVVYILLALTMFVVGALSIHAFPNSKVADAIIMLSGGYFSLLLSRISDSMIVLIVGIGIHAFILTAIISTIASSLKRKNHFKI